MTSIKTVFRAGDDAFGGKLIFVIIVCGLCDIGGKVYQTWYLIPLQVITLVGLLCGYTLCKGYFVVHYPDKVKEWRQRRLEMSFDIGAGAPIHWMFYMVKELTLLAIRKS